MNRALVVWVAAVCAVLVPVAASAQRRGADFVAEPQPGSDTAPGGGYFLVETEPGATVVQELGLRNDTKRTIELRLAAVDATTGLLGGVSYDVTGDPRDDVGRWLLLSKRSVRLGPGASAVVPFKITVPRDAASGTHVGGIAVYEPVAAEAGGRADQGQAGASVVVETRRIVAVQVELPGPDAPHLTITGVEPAARPDGLYLLINVTNDGHGLTKGQGVIELPREAFEEEFDIDTFVPGTAIGYPVRWTDAASNGEYEARVEISYDGGVATWSGTFTVGDEIQDELAERQVGGGGSQDLAGVLAAIVLAAAVSVALVALLLWRRRRDAGPLPVDA